jgi:hypothetical protein
MDLLAIVLVGEEPQAFIGYKAGRLSLELL